MSDQNTRAAQMQAYKRTVASRYRTLIESRFSVSYPGALCLAKSRWTAVVH